MMESYTEEELSLLHKALYELLGELDRVCRENNINYFIIGGSAIGAYFWDGIIPWDDDIDVGMTRKNYEKFMRTAPSALRNQFSLQNTKTEKHYPYFFAKLRKNGTVFSEDIFSELDMNQGIFLDIFPFDDIPSSKFLEAIQFKVSHFFCEVLGSTESWRFNHFGKNNGKEIEHRGYLACLLAKIIVSCLSKAFIQKCVTYIQSFYNSQKRNMCKNIITKTEYISKADAENPKEVKFGPLKTFIPRNIEEYLNTHYGKVVKDCPKELRKTHRPTRLDFGIQ